MTQSHLVKTLALCQGFIERRYSIGSAGISFTMRYCHLSYFAAGYIQINYWIDSSPNIASAFIRAILDFLLVISINYLLSTIRTRFWESPGAVWKANRGYIQSFRHQPPRKCLGSRVVLFEACHSVGELLQ